jgi:undecaprenyl-diphosphatase
MIFMIDFLLALDTKIFLLLNGWRAEWLDPLMVAISGKYTWIPLYLMILILLLWRFKKKSWFLLLAFVLLVFLTDKTSVHLFKNIFERLRPCHDPAIAHLVNTVDGRCGGQYGFVSSHASNVFGLALFITWLLARGSWRWVSVVMFLWATMVAYSRIYLGVHYPGDVLGGAILGMLMAGLVIILVVSLSKRIFRGTLF